MSFFGKYIKNSQFFKLSKNAEKLKIIGNYIEKGYATSALMIFCPKRVNKVHP